MKDSARKVMFAKKSASYQVGDKVVFSKYNESIYKLPKRKLFNPVKHDLVIGTGIVTNITNISIPDSTNGFIYVNTDVDISGGFEHFEKYTPHGKYKILPKNNIVLVDKGNLK